jgi:uncharacterized protein YsxB (DUF464 family)
VITVQLRLDGRGCLKSLVAAGHSLAGSRGMLASDGTSLPCAAVSVLARTAARIVAMEGRIASEGSAEEPGKLQLAVGRYPDELAEWLRGVTDTLARGLSDVAAEYPGEIVIDIR